MKSNWKRNIALFMTSQGLSLFGSSLVHYAVMWHITLETQSGVVLTLLTIAGSIPTFLMSPLGGAWADRHNKKFLIIMADAIIAVITLVMAVLFSVGIEYIGLLIICLVMRSFGQGVQTPAVNSLIPEIVPENKLTKVNGWNGSIQSLVTLASPMAGGALLAILPLGSILFVDVITAILGISILLFFVKVGRQVNAKKTSAKHYFVDIKQGLAYIKKHAFVKKFLLIAAIFNFMVAPLAILTPLQAIRDFGPEIWRLTAVELTFCAGMMLGGVLIGVWGGFKNKSVTLAVSLFLFSIGGVLLGVADNFWFYLAIITISGLALGVSNAPLMAILQAKVDPKYMGRVFSVLLMISSLMMPLGMVLWGPLGDAIPIDWIMIGTGLVMAVVSIVFITNETLYKAGLPDADESKTVKLEP